MTLSDISWDIAAAWDDTLTGLFRIDVSTLGSGDKLAGSFGAGSYDAITTCEGFTVERGAVSPNLGRSQAGSAMLTIWDSAGRYNPDNPTSPIADSLLKRRQLRIQATHSGTTYGMFRGFTNVLTHDPDRESQVSLIECQDLFEYLERAKPTIASMGSTTVGAAIGEILDAIEWTDGALRSLETGSSIPDFSADGTKTGLTLIQDLLAADRGAFFVNGAGVATYLSRTSRWLAGTADVTVAAEFLSSVKPTADYRSIINRQTVTRTGGTAQTYTDSVSANDNGYADGEPITTAYLNNDSEALQLATFLVAMNKTPRGRTVGVRLYGLDDTNITQQLTREIGDLVTVSEPGGGTSVTGYIEAIRHELRGALLVTDWLLSRRTANVFRIDVSLLDGDDVLAF